MPVEEQNAALGPGPRRDESLERAYRKTHFHVDTQPPYCLRIGERAADFAAWLAAQGYAGAVLITAWNPYSVPLDPAANAHRQAQLEAEAATLGLPYVGGRGEDPEGRWTAEESLCVFDPPLRHVEAWMRRFGQNAVVEVDKAGDVRLRWHPDLDEAAQ